ncbi:phage major capsid protein [Falsiruegeria mediterranea]|uniref:phage major capsid protein n=1 Tax=Falsiruegeria mediterranea TaxID=1280832 RepID=UPI0015F24D44|nr:phage major capsid protein [Falsiruegeria mediterranea]
MPRDFADDPRVKGLAPKHQKQMVERLQELDAATVWDSIAAEVAEAHETRKRLPEVLAKLEAVETALARPVSATLSAPKPAKATKSQARVPASRKLAAAVIAEGRRKAQKIPPAETLDLLLPGDEHKMARASAERLYNKAATAPASTTNAGWAAELVRSDVLEFWAALSERSASAQLRNMAVALLLDDFNSLTIPHRGAGDEGSLKPAWVQEGATIPVAQGNLGSTTLNRFKLGVISVMTQELLNTSNALDVVEGFILDDMAEGIDSYVFDPASTEMPAIRPGAITVGAPNQASAGDTLENILTDIAYLRSQLSNARRPAIVMHSDHMRALEMLVTPEGNFPLADRVARRDLWGLHLIDSPFVPRANVVGVDAAAHFHAADTTEIDVRGTVTLAMANAAGLAPKMTAGGTDDAVDDIGGSIHISDAAGTVPATAVRSTFQSNSVAIRVIQPVTWKQLHGTVAYLSNVTWAG